MKRVLFVCVGNSCRSQMAEGFGNYYGGEEVLCESAGTCPAGYVHPQAIEVMRELGIDISHHRSKSLSEFDLRDYDVVVSVCNESDTLCPATFLGHQLHWNIPDPVGGTLDEFRSVRDLIEQKVRFLMGQLLKGTKESEA